MNERFYLLKIQLLDIEPAIWRRFVVPAGITLDRLHDVIQIVMGWTDSHLHEFTIGNKRYTEYPESKEDGLVCGRYRLGDLIKQKGRTFHYLYDFGDSWMHRITLESQQAYKKDETQGVFLIDGANACPPEDCGGIYGYQEMLEALKQPHSKAAKEYREWLGKNFNAHKFNAKKVERELRDFPIRIF